jgi:hypothetical protein
MKTIIIDGRSFEYSRLDIQTSLMNHITLHLTLNRSKIDEKFIFDKFDKQTTSIYKSEYAFDVRHSFGTFFSCYISKLDTYKDDMHLDIISDRNNAKPLQEHRNEIIEDILSTSNVKNDIKTNNN